MTKISPSLQERQTALEVLEELMEGLIDQEDSLGKLITRLALMDVHREIDAEVFFSRNPPWLS